MAYITQPTTSYVKFVRGTKERFAQLIKSDDTLYFVYDNNDSTTGNLYLGNKLIGDGASSSLKDLIGTIAVDGDLLMYDESTDNWIPVSVDYAIRLMSGATAAADGLSGLVPAPKAGDLNKFLRGDGTWTTVSVGGLAADNKSIELSPTEKVLLKGYHEAAVGTLLQKTSTGLQWVTPQTIFNGITYKKVSSLADVNESSTIYFVPNNSGSNNSYDEYMYIDDRAELIGNTSSINLDGYVTTNLFNSTIGLLLTDINKKVNTSNFNNLSAKVTEIDGRLIWQQIVEE